MDDDQQRQQDESRRPAPRQPERGLDQGDEANEVDALQNGKNRRERPLADLGGEPGDAGTEDRRRVEGVGEPVVGEVAPAGGGEAVEEILILVGVIERRLPGGGRERGGPDQGGENPEPREPPPRAGNVRFHAASGPRVIWPPNLRTAP